MAVWFDLAVSPWSFCPSAEVNSSTGYAERRLFQVFQDDEGPTDDHRSEPANANLESLLGKVQERE
jgi:hypothetical protein